MSAVLLSLSGNMLCFDDSNNQHPRERLRGRMVHHYFCVGPRVGLFVAVFVVLA